MSRNERVLVAMSGGVDSSVAAALLKEQGYDCVGVFMWVGPAGDGLVDDPPPREYKLALPRLKKGCCSVGDACDARAVAARLGIPFYSVNFQNEFGTLIEYFVDEYAHARTPNPCVLCNSRLKFGRLLAYADLLDARYVATGHYARLLRGTDGDPPRLARAANRSKDQSYVLFGIARDSLTRCLFPLGEIADKAEVRRIAASLGLPVHDKPESQEICFVPDGDYAAVVRARRPDAVQPGPVMDATGRMLGQHSGVVHYTIGQRHGLRIATGRPMYVTHLDARTNTVMLGPREELLSDGLIADRVNWLVAPPPEGQARQAHIQIRYRHAAAEGIVRRLRVSAATERNTTLTAATIRERSAASPDAGRSPTVAALTTGAAPDPDAPQPQHDRSSRGRDTAPGNPVPAESLRGPETVEVRFENPQSAITPGQAAVFYDGDVVLGGGWIVHSLKDNSPPI